MANERRLIDATEAENWARDHILDAKERYTILDFLRECSTVNAVEVVRCKDCKNGTAWENRHGYTAITCRLMCADVTPDDFCSFGERKSGTQPQREPE